MSLISTLNVSRTSSAIQDNRLLARIYLPNSVSRGRYRPSLRLEARRGRGLQKVPSSHLTRSTWYGAASASLGSPALKPTIAEILAVALGYCVLFGSLFRSFPQIAKIIQQNSVEGLSLTSFVIELIAYSITWAYNLNLGYPFSTYGDIVACWLQDLVLVFLILRLRKLVNLRILAGSVAFAVFTGVLMTNIFGNQVLFALQASTILLMSFGARLPQIIMNHRRGNSGQLSFLTCLLNVLGCLTRMFTTFILTKDLLNFYGTALQLVMNGILFFQVVQTLRVARGVDPGTAKVA